MDVQHANDYIERLNGATVTRVSLDCWSVGLILDDYSLTVESEWRFEDRSGRRLDSSTRLEQRQAFELWRAVGQTVESIRIERGPYDDLVVRLSSGHKFTAVADDDACEDWQLATKGWALVCMGRI